MWFFSNNYYEEFKIPKVKFKPPQINAPAPKLNVPPPKINVPSKGVPGKNLGTDYNKYPAGSSQRRLSYDNYLKSKKTPPKILDDTSKVNKVSDDLNKIDNLDNINKVDDIPNLVDDTKKLLKSSPNDIKNDLPDAQKVDFDIQGKKLLDEINTPNFKSKTFKERLNSIKDWVKKNPGKATNLAAMTALATSFLAMYIKAKIDTDRINNTEYTITSITSNEDNEIVVLYDPQDKFTLKDVIIISETNSVPVIDGTGMELTYVGNGVISLSGEKITTNGSSGKLRCKTSVENQFTQTVTDVAEPIIDIPSNIADNIIDKIIPDSIKDFFNEWWWVVLIICILSICSSSAAAIGFIYMK